MNLFINVVAFEYCFSYIINFKGQSLCFSGVSEKNYSITMMQMSVKMPLLKNKTTAQCHFSVFVESGIILRRIVLQCREVNEE